MALDGIAVSPLVALKPQRVSRGAAQSPKEARQGLPVVTYLSTPLGRWRANGSSQNGHPAWVPTPLNAPGGAYWSLKRL